MTLEAFPIPPRILHSLPACFSPTLGPLCQVCTESRRTHKHQGSMWRPDNVSGRDGQPATMTCHSSFAHTSASPAPGTHFPSHQLPGPVSDSSQQDKTRQETCESESEREARGPPLHQPSQLARGWAHTSSEPQRSKLLFSHKIVACNKPPTDGLHHPAPQRAEDPSLCGQKTQSSDQIANAPRKKTEEEKIRNTNPCCITPAGTPRHRQALAARHAPSPGEAPFIGPCLAPAGRQRPPGPCSSCAVAGFTRVLGRKKSSKPGGQSMVGCLLAARRRRPANRGVGLGVGG